jgi:glutathione S-transferase
MLTFYYHPLSPVARRVWLALLEKEIPFEAKLVNLTGEQFQPDFLALNPFHHVPVVVDKELRLLESLAILDYLEAAYPVRRLLPHSASELAKVRMVQMVVVNELTPKLPAIINADLPLSSSNPNVQHLHLVLKFLNEQLGQYPYFGGDLFSLADIVAGATIPLLCRLGLSLTAYPALSDWHERIIARPAWCQSEPSDCDLKVWQRWIQRMIKRRSPELSQNKA